MQIIWILLLGLLAGWAVNLAADLIPERRSLAQGWYYPLCQLLPTGLLHQTGLNKACVQAPARPWRYSLVWIMSLFLGWLAYQQSGWQLLTLIQAGYAWFLLAIAVIDLEHRLVLNRMLLAALPITLFGSLILNQPVLISALLGAAVGFGSFLIIALLRPGAMGMGDVKLAGLIGLLIGFPGVIIALFTGIMAGGLAAILLLVHSRFGKGQTMAYAPYLVLGAWIALFAGTVLWHLSLSTLP